MPTKEQLAARAARNKLQRDLNRKIVASFATYLKTIGGGLTRPIVPNSLLRGARDTLTDTLAKTIAGATQQSLELAKESKASEYAPILSGARRILKSSGASAAEIERVTSLVRVSAYFGGGLDEQVIGKVWNKVWPDALNVDQRIQRLSMKATDYAEKVIRQGIAEGKSAVDMMNQIDAHFVAEGIEARAAFRLAAHTTNMTYEAARAAISMDVNFVMGIRIVRGMFGPASDTCEICYEHGGDDFKEYYKANGDDLAILADQPPYHSNCNCGTEDITETAEQFVQMARNS